MDKKIKLPQHLQLDSVSPATRLLEKRRAMYEVQKAFEDQKEEFRKKEENFKKREAELREKDILIQDHLIKFSTFLQSHEMRRKKDSELCKGELDKIVEKQSELEKGHFVKEELLHRSKKIEDKVKKMQKFEAFLEKVKEQHPDEFQELNDILARYKTLSDSNIKLQAQKNKLNSDLDHYVQKYQQLRDKGITEKIKLNNEISQRQQELEKLEDTKSRQVAENQEVTSKKMKQTTEHGQILMSIKNLFEKCREQPRTSQLLISYKEYIPVEPPGNFDDMKLSGGNAINMLKVIKQGVDNFKFLSDALKKQTTIQAGIQAKREKFDIV